jgi:hypothetical protein
MTRETKDVLVKALENGMYTPEEFEQRLALHRDLANRGVFEQEDDFTVSTALALAEHRRKQERS